MAKLLGLLVALMTLQICIETAPPENPTTRSQESPKITEAEPRLDNEAVLSNVPSEVTRLNENDDGNSEVQRQKRFYNYFSFGFSPYGPYDPFVIKRDNSQDTGVYGAENTLSQIFRRVQDILNYTRQQSLYPPAAPFPVATFIPVLYIPRGDCGCTPDSDEIPSNDEKLTTAPPLATTPLATPAQPISPAFDNADPSLTDESSKIPPEFPNRSQNMDGDDEDGARPISFVPVKPKTPLSRPAPPLDHGTIEGNNGNDVKKTAVSSSIPPPVFDEVAPESNFVANSPPSLCDGAVLTCCHRPEATYDCFVAQGCPDPTPKSCDPNAILDSVRKFEYYYTNRQG